MIQRIGADFVEQYCGEHVPRGLKVLYEDPDLGFQVLAHINDKARVSPPHDHGASWAIYGQATRYTDMTEWEREDDGSNPGEARLKAVKKYRLLPGQVEGGAHDHQPRLSQGLVALDAHRRRVVEHHPLGLETVLAEEAPS